MQVKKQLNEHLEGNTKHFDMVIGAKGSPLQLVLSSLLHIDNPTGNIDLEEAMKIAKKPMVKYKVPVSYGDNYKGYRILGTTHKYLEVYKAQLQSGRLYEKSFEAVVGSQVAKQINLKVGKTFVSSHGLAESGLETHEEKPFVVTGVLKPTGTIIDNLIITNLESIWEVHEHLDDKDHENEEEHQKHQDPVKKENFNLITQTQSHKDDDHDHERDEHAHENEEQHPAEEHKHSEEDAKNESEHDHKEEHHHLEKGHSEKKEITSLLVKFRNPIGALQTSRFVNEKSTMQAAIPKFEIDRLTTFLGVGFQTINGISLAILFIASLSIFINVVRSVTERKQELALLRTYGISTFQLIKLVFLEALMLTLISAIFGWLFGRLGVWVFSVFSDAYGYDFQFGMPNREEVYMLLLVMVTTLPAAIIASLSLLKLNVSKILADA
ncbi:hypothetical protein GCM10009430_27190 [Aquimarina litoralis]|uniref:ABC transport system permease protein n=1 Tax=Aquimarina litoralis TaxID=584605 RepID=A0ABP3U5G4_9FLAO